MTVLEVIRRSTDYLNKHGVDSARLQVELLLAHLLKLPRLQLYLNFERTLGPEEIETLRRMVQRRGRREPLQHILGNVSFDGVEIGVNRHVLIPRPETEQLALLAVRCMAALPAGQPAILDLCTGSGCLAVYLALRFPNARFTATDKSIEALETAKANASQHGVLARIDFRQGDLFAACADGSRFDLVVTNPPYIPSAEIVTLEPEVRDHDPRMALDGGPDGLDFYRRLCVEAPDWMTHNACFMAEFGDEQGPKLMKFFARDPWRDVRLEKDLSDRERFFIASAGHA